MTADVFALLIMICKEPASVDTCTAYKKEFAHTMVTADACQALFRNAQPTINSQPGVAIKGHRCAKLAELFPGMKLAFGPSAPADPAPQPQATPGGDPPGWTRM